MSLRVLIVDDRPTNLRIFAQFVTAMGAEYDPTTFANPTEALAWVAKNQVDLMVIDYHMPEMNADEFLRRVRRIPTGCDAPAIVITAHQDRECRLAALDAGATDFLQSPVSPQEFADRVSLLVDKSRRSLTLKQRASGLTRKHAESSDAGGAAMASSGSSMLEQIIDTLPIMINATDRSGRCLFVNAHQAALLNATPEELVGQQIASRFAPELGAASRRRDAAVLKSQQPIAHYEASFDSDGVELVFHCNKSPLRNQQGETIGVLTTAVDITARKFAEEHRTHLALHDMLTGLPNRALLAEKIQNAIGRRETSGERSTLLLLDLDRFKVINDTRGHLSGDILLREVANRIRDFLSKKDFAARIGGDEFAIILADTQDAAMIDSRCTKLLKAISRDIEIDGIDQSISASVGLSMIGEDAENYEELLRLSDLAMYEAKASGRNCYRFYREEMNEIAQQNAKLEAELRQAIARDEFALEYQPIVALDSLRIVNMEALIRWDHPTRGRLLPNSFIQVADDNGLIDQLGEWVIDKACREIRHWAERGLDLPRVSINVSPRQFQRGNLCDLILDKMREHALAPEKLVVEITEELLLDHNGETAAELDRLRAAGIGISIDDFGTGYSSLQYLRDLPANCLKIDRAFVSRIETSPADRAIISTIAHLAHALGMRVVAEGVENEGQLDLLRVSGCDEVQGFAIARPHRSERLDELFPESAHLAKAG